MKKIIIDFSKIKHHDEIDISLLKEGFIFNECGKVVWINSFQKGRDRNKGLSTDKTYIADKQDKK